MENEYNFLELHPQVALATASDRYSGWLGQIYTPEYYSSRLTNRVHTVGGKRYVEEVLPVDSVAEYFEHFPALELDFTFYQLLRDEQGEPTSAFHVLQTYCNYLRDDRHLLLKAPQAVFAAKLRHGDDFGENPNFLNAEMFTRCFYEPAKELLGSRLKGIIFEQEYQRRKERTPPKEFAALLNDFFSLIPEDRIYHVELRTESYLSNTVFQVLHKYGVGQALSHWTWLPPLMKQFRRADGRFLSKNRQVVIRLLTPRRIGYARSFEAAFPFDRLLENYLDPQMIKETAELMHLAVKGGYFVYVVVNNRAGGNAPEIARRLAEEFSRQKE